MEFMSGDPRLRQVKSSWASRGRTVAVEVLVFLLALGGMAVSATACEGVGGPELTTLSTSLSGEGKEGTTITVLEGSKVKDKATLKGKNASSATGKVTYKVYSESECKTLVKEAGEVTVSGESVPVSSEVELEGGASYYWQAHYSGDSKNAESTSECTEISTVKAKTSLSTELTSEGEEAEEGEELTELEDSKTTDKAALSGTKSSTAGGKAVYKLYSDSECKTLDKEAGEVTVSSGSIPASSEEELKTSGSYSWQATYTGDSLHQESKSACKIENINVRRVWYIEEPGNVRVKLYTLMTPTRSLAAAATISGFQLNTVTGSEPQITIKCGSVTTKNGTIKERIEMNTEFVLQTCTVTSPANCEIKEGATVGQITFKSLEGRLDGEEVRFREGVLGTPVASFEVVNQGAMVCSERGTYKLTGARLRAFTALISNFETLEATKKVRLTSESAHSPIVFTLSLTNERTSKGKQAELAGEIGLQLTTGEKWATTAE